MAVAVRIGAMAAAGLVLVLVAMVGAASGFVLTVDGNNNLVDELGRTRIFHGVNVVYKAPPYHPRIDVFDPQFSFTEQDAADLQAWGFNAIRLGVMWPGVEPVRGQYNHTYLAIMKNITAVCQAHGIAVLVEMHQDVFSEKFCGEGVPLWAAQPANGTKAFPEPLKPPYQVDARGVPLPSECSKGSWPNYYFTSALGSAVQALYDNHDGLLDSFAAYWKLLAQEFGQFDNVLGFEVMNEPWSGDAVKDPLLMLPGVADRKNLQSVYERVAAAIRTAAPHVPVFFESVTWDDVLVGFTQSPGGEAWRNKSVLAYHWYRPPNFGTKETFETRKGEAKRLGCGWFCSESDGLDLFEHADTYLQSWLRWEYKAYVPMTGSNNGWWFLNGTINTPMLSNLTRTYATAIAGNAHTMSYDPATARFELVFEPRAGQGQVTEVFAFESMHYPRGVSMSVSPQGTLTWHRVGTNRFTFVAASGMRPGTVVTLTLTNGA